ncbi:DUF1127 domain-containing protein [Variovorax sp. J22P168]|uniref:DUF1127 domain-containing protein n=1 Tax=Variovorax jilinensis TaxID=3053513 RepID=UPI002578A553|nr:DUF1127 domain-containing protein [Variovorax sp. J22P168]MDM0014333.1 DUF1127 domain-containing protein [Variovorax sp. J22P168]
MSSRTPTPFTRLFDRLFAPLREARRRHGDRRLLADMSERELRDLGVGRSQIPGLLGPRA